jgi:hypothetical protein
MAVDGRSVRLATPRRSRQSGRPSAGPAARRPQLVARRRTRPRRGDAGGSRREAGDQPVEVAGFGAELRPGDPGASASAGQERRDDDRELHPLLAQPESEARQRAPGSDQGAIKLLDANGSRVGFALSTQKNGSCSSSGRARLGYGVAPGLAAVGKEKRSQILESARAENMNEICCGIAYVGLAG